MEYTVLIHAAEEGGFWAEVPSLDGCFAQGESVEETIEDARGSIASHLEALGADGQPIPVDRVLIIATVAVPRTPAVA